MQKTAIIIGAGPAGLTAAYELLQKTDIKPIILEKSADIGGLSKTINYKGNRIDIGGHRFFSKSDRVMNWWLNILKLDPDATDTISLGYQNKNADYKSANFLRADKDDDKVMLIRNRVSHIYFDKKFFTYPVTLSVETIRKLGLSKIFKIGFSYLGSRIKRVHPELTLEDFFINRFGNVLYQTFFKDYTEKVWGVPCNKIPAEWGAQRVKEFSIAKALLHGIRSKFSGVAKNVSQKDTDTTLIQKFLYPKYGPGQLWEEVAALIVKAGGEIHFNQNVEKIHLENNKIVSIDVSDSRGPKQTYSGDYFFSSMPVQELIAGMGPSVPDHVKDIAAGLQYRDFVTVGMLVNKMLHAGVEKRLSDTWIYIQDKEVKLGRLQIFNNWSPSMVSDPDKTWLGLEFFCYKNDSFWNLSDEETIRVATDELNKIELISKDDVLDATVIRVEKTYPAYFGTYEHFDQIRTFTDGFVNLFLVGRNGMHKYNNADHSMLTAMTAVDNIINGSPDKNNIWKINTEQEYQE